MTGSISSRKLIISTVVIGVLGAAPALAQPVVVINEPIADVRDNLCLVPPEPVSLQGQVIATVYGRIDRSGGHHITLRMVERATGLGLVSGRKYELRDENVEEFNWIPLSPLETTMVFNHVFVRQGSVIANEVSIGGSDDFMTKSTVHLTINANGVPTADVAHDHDPRCLSN